MSARRLPLALLLALAAACGSTPASPPADAGPDGGAASDGGGLPDGGTSDGGAGDGGAAAVEVKVQAVYPGQGPAAGGLPALVTGEGFVEGFAVRGGGAVSRLTEVRVGGVLAADVDVIDDNRLSLTIPAGPAGPADVAVKNPNGTGLCAGCFRWLAHVQVDSVVPGRGATAGGAEVTVRGDGFAEGMLLTVGGAPLVDLRVLDARTARGLVPPGRPGGAEVAAVTRDGSAALRSAFVYQDPLALVAVLPSRTSTAGGAQLAVRGRGFTAQARVLLDGQPLASRWVDEETLLVSAPAHAEGPADLAVADDGALGGPGAPAATLARALVFEDPSAAPGPLALAAVAPRVGPLSGGTCPGACLRLVGRGLSAPGLEVRVGGTLAPVHPLDDRTVEVDLPAGSAPGPAEVAVAAASSSAAIPASDPGGFRYAPPLALAAIAPARLPASGAPAAQVTVTGEGFDQSPGAPLEVRLGALPLAGLAVAAGGRSLTGTAPAGASGLADLTVTATDADGFRRSAALAGAVRFTAPLKLLQVSPSRGAQAGGTRVAFLGDGFEPGLVAGLGGRQLSGLNVVSATRAEGLTPAGNPGAVDAQAVQAAAQAVAPGAFSYFDPQSSGGGAGGLPLLGALNVSVLENSLFKDGGVAGASVFVRLPDGAQLSKLTDLRGQVTFSDARLVVPVQVTVAKALYQSITVAAVQTENLSVYLAGPAGPPPPPPDPLPPPSPPAAKATVGGRVWGFKAPPGLVLQPNQRLVAWVRTAASSIYGGPPFSPMSKPIVVAQDGGTWSFETTRLSPVTVYALFGVETTRGENLQDLEPLLLGVRRGLEPNPDKPITDGDILLDTHLDQAVDATFDRLPEAGVTLRHDAAVDLDLGNGGIIPLGATSTTGDRLRFPHLPQAAGQGFVFIDIVSRGTAESVYLRRIFGDVSGGLVLGPYLPFPRIVDPLQQGAFHQRVAWTLAPGLVPNLLQVQYYGTGLGTDPGLQWTAVLPPGATEVTLPEELWPQLHPGPASVSVSASLAPGFDYTYWTYYDLYGGSWTAWAYDGASVVVP